MKKALFIVNPVSGTLKARDAIYDMIKSLTDGGFEPTVALTECRGHATRLAMLAERRGFARVIACGGDGTLNEVVSGLLAAGSRLPVGYIPCGSTNDFASSLGIPLDPKKSARVAAGRRARRLDVGCFGEGRYFNYVASFGAFSQCSYSVPQDLKNSMGHMAYVLGGIGDIFKIKPIHMICRTKNERIEGDFIYGSISNSTSIGGALKFRPELVDFSDGLFEVLLIAKPETIDDGNRIAQALMNSKFENCDALRFFRASALKITLPDDAAWSLDGERAAASGATVIRNIPSALTLLV